MRGCGNNTRYTHTAQECADAICSCPAFSHVNKQELIGAAEYNGFDRPEYGYCPSKDVHVIEDNGHFYDASWFDKRARIVTFFQPQDFINFTREKYGSICKICKEVHFDNGFDINRKAGWRVLRFLEDEIGTYFHYQPLCADCADCAGTSIFGTHKKALLYGIEKPTDEEIQLAVCEWLAEIVNRQTLKLKRTRDTLKP